MSKKNENNILKWYHLFSKYFVMGLFLIIASILIDITTNSQYFVIIIIKNLLQTVGIALLIGSIFDFSKNSQSFLDLVSGMLYQIVVSKEFLKKLGDDDKKQALELILRPSSEQIENCANIDDYFKKGIDNSMSMFKTDFKTNLVIHAEAVKEDGKVIVKGVMTNRVYRIDDKYEPIFTTFERDECSIIETTIIHPEGEGNPEIKEKSIECSKEENEQIAKKYELKIPEELERYPYLTIRRVFQEIGFDHWTNFHWTSLTPCDGIVFHLKCIGPLVVKDCLIFDDKKLYNITQSEDKKALDIISINWLNRYTGFTMTISEDVGKEEKGVSNGTASE